VNVLPLERIERIAADPARCTAPVPPAAPDLARPFMPEDQTQLYYTPAYARLGATHRLRYTQLFAMRVNEYIMLLEREFVEPVLQGLRTSAAVAAQPLLRRTLEGMLAEESRHYQVFAALNRRCAPAHYRQSDWYFMRLRPIERAALQIMQAGARWLPFALWIIVAMEESSIGLATAMVRGASGGPLGPLDAHFVAVHREHAKDEARHIHIDVHLIRACLASAPAPWRALNARLFMALMRDMTAPKANGTGARVVRQLVCEFPELAPLQNEMITGLVALRDDATFQHSVFNRRLTPLAFALYDQEPALAELGRILKSYERRAAA